MSQKKVLFITNQLPFPPTTGGKIKSWNLVKFLSETYDLSVCSLTKNDESLDESRMLEKLDLKFYYSEQLDIGRNAINLLKSYLKKITLNVYRNRSKKFQAIVHERIASSDLVIVDHYDMYPYVLGNNGVKKILHEHNAEFRLWKRMGELEMNPLKKAVLISESKRVKKAELEYCNDSDLIWAAPNDGEDLKKLAVDSSKIKVTYHLGDDKFIDYPNIEFSQTKENIVFVGTQSWEANIDGLEWFFEKCWPFLKKQIPNSKVFVIGKDPDKRVTKYGQNDKNIVFTGFVEELEEYYSRSRVSIVPLRFGSGMKVKLLNSMFRGIPTVTTSVGAEGIELENGKNIYISDDPLKFAEAIIELMKDQKKWEKFRDNSRDLVRNKYTWKSLLMKHKNEIDDLIGS